MSSNKKPSGGKILRIIGGSLRGRKIRLSARFSGRPTRDMVREALFSIIGQDIYRCVFLDLFAGSGANGFEAISRGARKAILVDMSPVAINSCIESANHFGVSSQVEIKRMEASRYLQKASSDGQMFDIIFADPPYEMKADEFEAIIAGGSDCLAENGILIVEVAGNAAYPENIAELVKYKERIYGGTKLCFYKRALPGDV